MGMAALDDHLAHLPRCDGRATWQDLLPAWKPKLLSKPASGKDLRDMEAGDGGQSVSTRGPGSEGLESESFSTWRLS